MEGSTLGTVQDTEAVARAKAEHAALFANIAAAHQVSFCKQLPENYPEQNGVGGYKHPFKLRGL